MPKLVKTIKFNNNYPKIHGQEFAKLVLVLQDIPGEMLLNQLQSLMFYDAERSDGRFYKIDCEQSYMLLLFVGDENIMFSTLRKQNQENVGLFAESVGELYKIEIED